MRGIEWAAGFYEGEGSCSFRDAGDKGRQLGVKVTQVDRQTLDWFREIVGAGAVYGPRRNGRGQDYYEYKCGAGRETLRVLLALRPYLSDRRQAQIDSALEAWEQALSDNSPAEQRAMMWRTRRDLYGRSGCRPGHLPTGRPRKIAT